MKKHNCIEKVRKSIMDNDPSIKGIYFDLSTIMSFDRKSEEKTGQRVEIRQAVVNKKGIESEKTRKSFVTHTYCPFCGVKYK